MVRWAPEDYGKIVSSDSSTNNGESRITVTSDYRVGLLKITSTAGDISEQIEIEKSGFEMSLATERQFEAPLGSPVVVTVSVPGSEDGAPINWVSTLGTLIGDETVKGEQASAIFTPGPFAGNAKLFAGVGQQWTQANISLAHPNNKPVIQLDNPLLIGDLTQDGAATLDRLDGTQRTIEYKTQSNVKITGLIAGETYQIRLGSVQNPNVEPIAWYFMDDIYNGFEVPDIYHDHNGTAQEVQIDRGTLYRGTGSCLE